MGSKTIAALCLCLACIQNLPGQQTVSTGSIQGVVTDPAGGALPAAKVTVTGTATGQVIAKTTSTDGAYNSGQLVPGDYSVRIEAKGFQTASTNIPVAVGVAASGSVQMSLGSTSEVIEVTASASGLETQQATVQGVVSASQIEN